MTRRIVVIAPAAESDIQEAFTGYRERIALLADVFRPAVFDSMDAIARSPLSRPADAEGNRHRVLRRFPFSVFYEVIGRPVTVLAIARHWRAPVYRRGG